MSEDSSKFIAPNGQDDTVNKVPHELKDVSPEKIEEILSYCAKIYTFYSGPLPPASELKKYNEAVPNGGERIMQRFEEQSKNRIRLESIAIPSQIRQDSRGQVFGFIIAVLAILSGVSCIFKGYVTAGTIIASSTVVSLVTVFVVGKGHQKKDLDKKNVDKQ